ncbi:MAG TPA: hypothetical protein VIR32_02190 [Lachnospiraceae bacterium]
MAFEESVLNNKIIASILLDEYGLHTVDVHSISFGSANCYKVSCAEGYYFLKEYQSWFTLDDIEREAQILEFLSLNKYPTALFLKNLEGKYGIQQSGHIIGVQEFIEGDTYTNKLSHVMLMESAAYLGKLHQILKGYPMKTSMDNQWVQGFSVSEATARCDKLLDILEENTSDKYYERIRSDLTYKKELNKRLENVKTYFIGITYSPSHGDYTACQLIGKHDKIKAVIDFSSTSSLPIVWEIMRAFIQSSESCKGGKSFDLDKFLLYVKEYMEYFSLSKRDLEAMPYIYLFQLGRSLYGFEEYLLTKSPNKDKLLEFAFWRTDICRQINEGADEISHALVQLV